jgi:hypothetical protein
MQNRREALKNIGLSLGTISMSSTLVSLIQSCTTQESWTPVFFSKDEAEIISITLDLILPATPNVPGAKELDLTRFIDGYIAVISTPEEKEGIKAGVGAYLTSTLEHVGKKRASSLTAEDIDGRLAYYLKADLNQQKKWEQEANAALGNNGGAPSADAVNFTVLRSLRNRSISAFKITEQIGENVLAYDPIPARQKGCVDLQEATQGKAWSL